MVDLKVPPLFSRNSPDLVVNKINSIRRIFFYQIPLLKPLDWQALLGLSNPVQAKIWDSYNFWLRIVPRLSMTREAVKMALTTTAMIAMMIKPFNQQTFLVRQAFLVWKTLVRETSAIKVILMEILDLRVMKLLVLSALVMPKLKPIITMLLTGIIIE